ncbi:MULTISPECIES: hypothetical protein [Rhizobium]|uniref:DinB/UmuC family translesion DNA polymerase n=1 Tax=Rhizobium TaxID=379 RepID=UPI0034E9763A
MEFQEDKWSRRQDPSDSLRPLIAKVWRYCEISATRAKTVTLTVQYVDFTQITWTRTSERPLTSAGDLSRLCTFCSSPSFTAKTSACWASPSYPRLRMRSTCRLSDSNSFSGRHKLINWRVWPPCDIPETEGSRCVGRSLPSGRLQSAQLVVTKISNCTTSRFRRTGPRPHALITLRAIGPLWPFACRSLPTCLSGALHISRMPQQRL